MLEPITAANSENAALVLQRWRTTPGIQSVFVSDTAAHFKNILLKKMALLLEVDHQFAVANSPWTSGTVESVMKEILRVLNALLAEFRGKITDWPRFVPMVQWALNSSVRERLGSSPYEAFFGRPPTSLLAPLARDHNDVVDVVSLAEDVLQNQVSALAVAVDAIHQSVTITVEKYREKRRRRQSKGELPNFAVGAFVLVARVRKQGTVSKMMSTWTGPRRVVEAVTPHEYQVQNIVTDAVSSVHVVR